MATVITNKYTYTGTNKFNIVETDNQTITVKVNGEIKEYGSNSEYIYIIPTPNICDEIEIDVSYISIPVNGPAINKDEFYLKENDIVPPVNLQKNIGSSTFQFNNIYSKYIRTQNVYTNYVSTSNIVTGTITYNTKLYAKGWTTFYKTIRPNSDNTVDIGTSSARFKDIYAANATIQTSDRNLKKDILSLNDDLVIAIFERLRPVEFKMIDGVRTHYGFIAQEIEDIHNELGIDIAWLIKSKEQEEIETINSETGEITYDYIEKPNGKTYYGLRYEEFISLQTRYTQLLKKEIDDIKLRLDNIGA